MGLDLLLGGLVLVSAIRGWLKGFLVQAIRLGGMIAAVYLAAPERDLLKPYLGPYLPTMKPELLDRLVWWGSAAFSYFLIVGVANVIIGASRRKRFGLEEVNRGDQFAGFGLGVVKGLVVASFVVASVQKRAEPLLGQVPWAQNQIKESYSWEWNQQYKPADQIWAAPPVQQFVGEIQKNGLFQVSPAKPPATEADSPNPVQTASRTPKLAIHQFQRKSFPRRSFGSKPHKTDLGSSDTSLTGLDPTSESGLSSPGGIPGMNLPGLLNLPGLNLSGLAGASGGDAGNSTADLSQLVESLQSRLKALDTPE
jgi:uncharacterized membrane protein required for colicin V production